MRGSERDRGLFIQYLARKYAERALNQRSAPCVAGWREACWLSGIFSVLITFFFSRLLFPFGHWSPQASWQSASLVQAVVRCSFL